MPKLIHGNIEETQPIYNSFYIPTKLTEEQKSRFLKYQGISKPDQKTTNSPKKESAPNKNDQ